MKAKEDKCKCVHSSLRVLYILRILVVVFNTLLARRTDGRTFVFTHLQISKKKSISDSTINNSKWNHIDFEIKFKQSKTIVILVLVLFLSNSLQTNMYNLGLPTKWLTFYGNENSILLKYNIGNRPNAQFPVIADINIRKIVTNFKG